jgi:hypothetical protein
MHLAHIVLFLAVSFGWSWGFWSLPVLAHRGVDLPATLAGLAASGTPALILFAAQFAVVAFVVARFGPARLRL